MLMDMVPAGEDLRDDCLCPFAQTSVAAQKAERSRHRLGDLQRHLAGSEGRRDGHKELQDARIETDRLDGIVRQQDPAVVSRCHAAK
jgi:hypothetical protein